MHGSFVHWKASAGHPRATAIEYGLIVALIVIAMMAALQGLRTRTPPLAIVKQRSHRFLGLRFSKPMHEYAGISLDPQTGGQVGYRRLKPGDDLMKFFNKQLP
jgi:hypothetical protein